MIGGLDAPWIRPGEAFDFEREALAVWRREIDAAIGDLIAAPMTLLDTVAHPDGIEPDHLAAVLTRLLAVAATGGPPGLDHIRRWRGAVGLIAAQARQRGRAPRFKEPEGDWQAGERALAFACLMALTVERAEEAGS